jgi:hypothetical protein
MDTIGARRYANDLVRSPGTGHRRHETRRASLGAKN